MMLPTSFDRGKIVYDAVTPLLIERISELKPRDMVITCRGASGCGEHVLHMPSSDPATSLFWCSAKSLHMLRTYIYNEVVAYIVPARFEGSQECTTIVLPNLGLRICIVEQSILDRHKKVLNGLAAGSAVHGTRLPSDHVFGATDNRMRSRRPGARRYIGCRVYSFKPSQEQHRNTSCIVPRATSVGPHRKSMWRTPPTLP